MSSNRWFPMKKETNFQDFDDGEIGFSHAGEHGDQEHARHT